MVKKVYLIREINLFKFLISSVKQCENGKHSLGNKKLKTLLVIKRDGFT